jgi:hypothetical protein
MSKTITDFREKIRYILTNPDWKDEYRAPYGQADGVLTIVSELVDECIDSVVKEKYHDNWYLLEAEIRERFKEALK